MPFSDKARAKALKVRRANAKLRKAGKLPPIVHKPKTQIIPLDAIPSLPPQRVERLPRPDFTRKSKATITPEGVEVLANLIVAVFKKL